MASNHHRVGHALNEVPCFCMIMGLIESGPAALSGSKELTSSSSLLG